MGTVRRAVLAGLAFAAVGVIACLEHPPSALPRQEPLFSVPLPQVLPHIALLEELVLLDKDSPTARHSSAPMYPVMHQHNNRILILPRRTGLV